MVWKLNIECLLYCVLIMYFNDNDIIMQYNLLDEAYYN